MPAISSGPDDPPAAAQQQHLSDVPARLTQHGDHPRGACVVFNTTMGMVQQVRAERAMAALRRQVTRVARVVRDGVVVPLQPEGASLGDLAE